MKILRWGCYLSLFLLMCIPLLARESQSTLHAPLLDCVFDSSEGLEKNEHHYKLYLNLPTLDAFVNRKQQRVIKWPDGGVMALSETTAQETLDRGIYSHVDVTYHKAANDEQTDRLTFNNKAEGNKSLRIVVDLNSSEPQKDDGARTGYARIFKGDDVEIIPCTELDFGKGRVFVR